MRRASSNRPRSCRSCPSRRPRRSRATARTRSKNPAMRSMTIATASSTTVAGTGPALMQVTASWDTGADIDLYVTGPLGDTLSFQRPATPSGARVDHSGRGECAGDMPNPQSREHPLGRHAPDGRDLRGRGPLLGGVRQRWWPHQRHHLRRGGPPHRWAVPPQPAAWRTDPGRCGSSFNDREQAGARSLLCP